jgi:hypothetical protein
MAPIVKGNQSMWATLSNYEIFEQFYLDLFVKLNHNFLFLFHQTILDTISEIFSSSVN